MDQVQKDPYVMAFMMQIVQEKHGDLIDSKFLEQEASRLYEEFGDKLVSYFEPMLTEEQSLQFDNLVKGGADQSILVNFLMNSIENLQERIQEVLIQFKNDYIGVPKTNYPF